MARRGDVHTILNPNGPGRAKKVDGEAVSRHQRKDTAVECGREIARENHSEHTIHRHGGTIGEKNR